MLHCQLMVLGANLNTNRNPQLRVWWRRKLYLLQDISIVIQHSCESSKAVEEPDFDTAQLWMHSYKTARGARPLLNYTSLFCSSMVCSAWPDRKTSYLLQLSQGDTVFILEGKIAGLYPGFWLVHSYANEDAKSSRFDCSKRYCPDWPKHSCSDWLTLCSSDWMGKPQSYWLK